MPSRPTARGLTYSRIRRRVGSSTRRSYVKPIAESPGSIAFPRIRRSGTALARPRRFLVRLPLGRGWPSLRLRPCAGLVRVRPVEAVPQPFAELLPSLHHLVAAAQEPLPLLGFQDLLHVEDH